MGFSYGNYWDRLDKTEVSPKVTVGVYSYVFGPQRQNDYGSIDEALEAVRKWHADEMKTTYGPGGWVI